MVRHACFAKLTSSLRIRDVDVHRHGGTHGSGLGTSSGKFQTCCELTWQDQAECADISDVDRRLNKLTFWPIVLLDFALAFGTGRCTTFDIEDITQSLPTEEEMRTQPARVGTIPVRSPFPYAARQMFAFGSIINLLNGRMAESPKKAELLNSARTHAVAMYSQLPQDMVWNAAKYVGPAARC